jgi:hypothetical protein
VYARFKEQKSNYNPASSRQLILELFKVLSLGLAKGFSRSNMFYMRSFYLSYKSVQTVPGHLSWSHYCELLAIENLTKKNWVYKKISFLHTQFFYYESLINKLRACKIIFVQ